MYFTVLLLLPEGVLKFKIIHNWVHMISPCSRGLARCRVTRQRCSVAPAPKLCRTEKLLPSHRRRLKKSFFPDLIYCHQLYRPLGLKQEQMLERLHNASPSFCMASKSVDLPKPNCTHSTSLLLVS